MYLKESQGELHTDRPLSNFISVVYNLHTTDGSTEIDGKFYNDIEGQQLIKILNSQLYVFLTKICQWGNFRNEQKVFSYLKYPKITDTEIDNEYVNNFFKLSENEINIISQLK